MGLKGAEQESGVSAEITVAIGDSGRAKAMLGKAREGWFDGVSAEDAAREAEAMENDFGNL